MNEGAALLWTPVAWCVLAAAKLIKDRDPRRAAKWCEVIANGWTDTNSLRLRRMRAAAAVSAAALWGQLRDEKSLALNDLIISTYGESSDPDLRAQAAWAMVNKGYELIEFGRPAEAIPVYQYLVRFVPAEPPFLEVIAQGLHNWAYALEKLDRHDEEDRMYDRIVELFSSNRDLPIREYAVWALVDKAISVFERLDFAHAIGICTSVLDRWGQVAPASMSLSFQDAVAAAFRYRAASQAALGEYGAAVTDVDQLANRYLGLKSQGVEEAVSWALVVKATALERLGRNVDAERTYDKVIERYRHSKFAVVRDAVLNARRLREGLET